MTTKKYPLISHGTPVKTTQPNLANRREWTEKAWEERKWGVQGKVITHHDSHGLCYHVRHEDGTEGYYNPDELEETYRELIIKTVRNQKDGVVNATFHNSCVGLLMAPAWLRERGIDSAELAEGRSILIKGRSGNEDFLLARLDALEDIILLPAPTLPNKDEGIGAVTDKEDGRGTMILG